MNMHVETRYPRDGVAVLTVSGELDVYSSPYFRETIQELLDRGVLRLLMDLNRVEYMDSTALGVLIGTLRRVSERGGHLAVVCDTIRIRRIFEITGLARVFDMHATEEEVLQSLEAV